MKSQKYTMMSSLNRLLFLLVVLLGFGCGEDEMFPPTEPGVAEKYFPLAIGQVTTYDVDSILLLQTVSGTVYDTALLHAREILVDTFSDPEGRLWYVGERFEKDRSAPESAYQIRRTFAVSADEFTALRQEENLVFTKLTSPESTANAWNGNQFDEFRQFAVGGEFLDIYAGWEYRFSDSTDVWQTNGQTFEDVAIVEQAQIDNLIDFRRAYEVYAPGVGLIESFLDARHTQCQVCCNGDTAPCFDLPWDEKAEKGFILWQRISN